MLVKAVQQNIDVLSKLSHTFVFKGKILQFEEMFRIFCIYYFFGLYIFMYVQLTIFSGS